MDIDAGNRAVELMSEAVRSTYSPAVLAGIGAFGGLFDAGWLKDMQDPVLVASTDGVGTKVMLAAHAGHYTSIGRDIVNHCINDILVQGARPLFFLDYFASFEARSGACGARSWRALLPPAGKPAAPCWAGKLPKCRGSTGRANLTWPVRSWAWLSGSESCPVRDPTRGSAGRLAVQRAAHQRLFPDPQGLQGGAPGYDFPELGVPWQDALLVPHRSYLPLLLPVLEMEDIPSKPWPTSPAEDSSKISRASCPMAAEPGFSVEAGRSRPCSA